MIVGTPQGDRPHQGLQSFASDSHQSHHLPTGPFSLAGWHLLLTLSAQRGFHQQTPHRIDCAPHLLLQAFEISHLQAGKTLYELFDLAFCYLHQCFF